MSEEKVSEETTEEQASEKSYFGMSANEIAGLAKSFMENKDSVKEIVKIFKPVIGEVTDLVMDTAGPEVYKVMLRVSLADVSIKKAVYDQYREYGFSEAQSFRMMELSASSGSNSGSMSKVVEAVSNSVAK